MLKNCTLRTSQRECMGQLIYYPRKGQPEPKMKLSRKLGFRQCNCLKPELNVVSRAEYLFLHLKVALVPVYGSCMWRATTAKSVVQLQPINVITSTWLATFDEQDQLQHVLILKWNFCRIRWKMSDTNDIATARSLQVTKKQTCCRTQMALAHFSK